MKRIIFAFLFLLALQVKAAVPTSAGEFNVCVPLFHGNLELGATGIWLKSSTSDLEYALVFPSILNQEGRFKSDHPGVDFGYQIYLGYIFPCSGNDLRLTYTDFFSRERDHVGAPEGIILPVSINPAAISIPIINADISFIHPTITITIRVPIFFPAEVPVTGQVLEADVKDEFKFQAVDLDFGQFVDIDTFFRLRWFGGLRHSHIKHKFDTHYVVGNFTATQTQTLGPYNDLIPPFLTTVVTSTMNLMGISQFDQFIAQTSDFEGIGPRLGTEGTFHLGGGFGLTGTLSTALLVGEQQSALSDRLQGNVSLQLVSVESTATPIPGTTVVVGPPIPPIGTIFTGDVTNIVENFDYGHVTRIVPNLEAKLGLNYTYLFENCRTFTLEIGYYVNHYFNAIDRLAQVGATRPELRTRNTIDAEFHGPYLSLQVVI